MKGKYWCLKKKNEERFIKKAFSLTMVGKPPMMNPDELCQNFDNLGKNKNEICFGTKVEGKL